MNSINASQYTALNAICPYFTMFPLDFPYNILNKRSRKGEAVLDPFCGRGTTIFAARLLGLASFGVDSSPIAASITASKLVRATPSEIIAEAKDIIASNKSCPTPVGEFWEWAFHPAVLKLLCRFRQTFLDDCNSGSRIALRGIILGALHGPKQKIFPSYFSNQAPRTYSPKPAYAIQFWRSRNLNPDPINVLSVIERRANRYYKFQIEGKGAVRWADSRSPDSLLPVRPIKSFNWVITSPPYYGMRTYIPDQWLRNWFLGGPDRVEYSADNQLTHSSPDQFISDLRIVWRNTASVCTETATLVARFGGISDRKVKPRDLIKESFKNSGWKVQTIHEAGMATDGRRQADSFLHRRSSPMLEYDVWARKD